MKNSKVIKAFNQINEVPGFVVDDLVETSTDKSTGKSSQFIAVGSMVSWFWLKYPEGKIDWEVVHVNPQMGEAIAVCKIYASRYDAPEAFITKASARFVRTPGSDEWSTGGYYERAQTSALGRALRFAGFGCQSDAYAGDTPPGTYDEEDLMSLYNTDMSYDSSTIINPESRQSSYERPPMPEPPPERNRPVVTVEECEQLSLDVPEIQAQTRDCSKVLPLPATYEQALDTVVSLPRFGGQTFREVLSAPGNAGVAQWICNQDDYAGVDNPTRVAAQIIALETATGSTVVAEEFDPTEKPDSKTDVTDVMTESAQPEEVVPAEIGAEAPTEAEPEKDKAEPKKTPAKAKSKPEVDPKTQAIPETLEEALDIIVSLPRFGGAMTFREVLADPENSGVVKWICSKEGLPVISEQTLAAARIIAAKK